MAKSQVVAVGVAQAEPRDLDALYREHAEAVKRWTVRLAGPFLDVEDVVHEVFMVAQRRLPEFRGDAKISTWLYRITDRVVRKQRGKQRLRRWLSGSTSDYTEDMATDRPDPFDDVARKQASRIVYAALDGLPHKQRTAVVLYELEGLSGQEIADLTDTKLATVWVLLHRGRARFLEQLEAMKARGAA